MANSRIPTLVLMQLAALGGCRNGAEQRPPETEPTLLPVASASAAPPPGASGSTAPTPVATVAPLGSGAPVTSSVPSVAVTSTSPPVRGSATTAGKGRARKEGEVCDAERACETGLYCVFGFNGAVFSKTGTCGVHKPIYEGRPLVVDGHVHTASLRFARDVVSEENAANGDLLATLRTAAVEEHASIAAFARTIAELMALGAPSWLLGATAQALSDEVRHASRTLDFVERFGGGKVEPSPLSAAVAPLRAGVGAPEALYRDVFRGGAIGETLAAARADVTSLTTKDPELAAFRRELAEDEARHAALAFRTLQWLSATFPELEAVREEETTAFRQGASAADRALVEPLLVQL
ncbi:MAG: hypothetical protein U0174_05805 [Polyangiaceae bacterium]